jgi:hypothetical protein
MENLGTYIKNFESLYNMILYQFWIEKIINKSLKNLQNNNNSPSFFLGNETKDFLQKIYKYQTGKENFIEFTLYLKNKYEKYNRNKIEFQHKYKYLHEFLYLAEIGKNFDFSIINIETSHLIKKISNILSREEIKNLNTYKIDNIVYYEYINYLIKKYQIKIQKLPNLDKYLSYIDIKLNYYKIFEEIWYIQEEILENLEYDNYNKNLLFIITYLNYIKEQINFQAFKLDINFLINNETKFYKICKILDTKLSNYEISILKNYLKDMKNFYYLADKRNEIFLENIENSHFRESLNVMCVGGYHIEGITQILRAKNISYIVITPAIGNKETIYKEVYINKINKLSDWVYRQKYNIEKKNINSHLKINNIFLAIPSIFDRKNDIDTQYRIFEKIHIKTTRDETVFTKMKNATKKAWKENKWSLFGIFVYSLFFISVLTSLIISATPFNLFVLAAVIVSVSVIILSIIATKIRAPILNTILKIMVLSAISILTFIFSPFGVSIITLSYIFIDISLSLNNVYSKRENNKYITSIMGITYLFSFITKIVALTGSFIIYFVIPLAILAIIGVFIYPIIPDTKAKHLFRAFFYIVCITLNFLIGVDNNYIYSIRTISNLSNNLIDISIRFQQLLLFPLLNTNNSFKIYELYPNLSSPPPSAPSPPPSYTPYLFYLYFILSLWIYKNNKSLKNFNKIQIPNIKDNRMLKNVHNSEKIYENEKTNLSLLILYYNFFIYLIWIEYVINKNIFTYLKTLYKKIHAYVYTKYIQSYLSISLILIELIDMKKIAGISSFIL